MIRKYAEIFCWKNVSSFCSAKATHIFSAKNIRILYIESAKTVNEMTLNELVKLTTLWTTGPSQLTNRLPMQTYSSYIILLAQERFSFNKISLNKTETSIFFVLLYDFGGGYQTVTSFDIPLFDNPFSCYYKHNNYLTNSSPLTLITLNSAFNHISITKTCQYNTDSL